MAGFHFWEESALVQLLEERTMWLPGAEGGEIGVQFPLCKMRSSRTLQHRASRLQYHTVHLKIC